MTTNETTPPADMPTGPGNYPSKEWLQKMAEAEDKCPSISVGGLACELGLNVDGGEYLSRTGMRLLSSMAGLPDGSRWIDIAPVLSARLRNASGEVERLRAALIKQQHEIQQTLGEALNYPKFSDDQKNFPGATGDGVCVGDHVAESLAAEAAKELERLRGELDGWVDTAMELEADCYLLAAKVYKATAERDQLREANAELRRQVADADRTGGDRDAQARAWVLVMNELQAAGIYECTDLDWDCTGKHRACMFIRHLKAKYDEAQAELAALTQRATAPVRVGSGRRTSPLFRRMKSLALWLRR